MPNFPTETGIGNVPWERIRKEMCEIRRQRAAIGKAEQRIAEACTRISYVLWPRTNPDQPEQQSNE